MKKVCPVTPYKLRESARNPLVGHFGWSRTTQEGEPKFHAGIDLAAPVGTTLVHAAHDGEIVRAGFQTNRFGEEKNEGYGLRVYLRLDGEVETRYAHLLWQVYKVGMKVHAGAVLGAVGDTGNTKGTPPHLHWETRLWNGAAYHAVNPVWWLYGDDLATEAGVPKPA